VLPHEVVDVEKGAHDDAGHEHDDGALDDLVLARPLDLLELPPGLRDEVPAALFRLPGLDADGRMPLGARVRHRLARLPVRRVPAAPPAVLAELDAVRRVPLGLRRLVVPPPALRARERDPNSDSGLGHVCLACLFLALVVTPGTLTHCP